METVPIFVLANQLLVWVVGKVLVYYNLDLVLTEYYKKRLDFQMKNKKTYTNEDKLTESIVLNILNLSVPFAWISTLKPSSTRPLFPFFTLLLYLLSLLSQLTSSILSISYYNNITCFFCQIYVTTSSLPISAPPLLSLSSISIQGISKKVMAANTLNSESTSTSPQLRLLMLRLCHIQEQLMVCFLMEPILAYLWKGLRICAMTIKCQSLKKSIAYLNIMRCLPPDMLDQ